MVYEVLKKEVMNILYKDETLDRKLYDICDLLRSAIAYYDWVGFYFRNGEKEELILGPYAGAPTEHTVIPFGKGICGQVAVSNANFVVDDVSAQNNYISCNAMVKSEIVIPLFLNGENVGQIDIDSNILQAFTSEDVSFLEWLNDQVSKQMI